MIALTHQSKCIQTNWHAGSFIPFKLTIRIINSSVMEKSVHLCILCVRQSCWFVLNSVIDLGMSIRTALTMNYKPNISVHQSEYLLTFYHFKLTPTLWLKHWKCIKSLIILHQIRCQYPTIGSKHCQRHIVSNLMQTIGDRMQSIFNANQPNSMNSKISKKANFILMCNLILHEAK